MIYILSFIHSRTGVLWSVNWPRKRNVTAFLNNFFFFIFTRIALAFREKRHYEYAHMKNKQNYLFYFYCFFRLLVHSFANKSIKLPCWWWSHYGRCKRRWIVIWIYCYGWCATYRCAFYDLHACRCRYRHRHRALVCVTLMRPIAGGCRCSRQRSRCFHLKFHSKNWPMKWLVFNSKRHHGAVN